MTSEPPVLTPEAALAPPAAGGTRLPLPEVRFMLGGGGGELVSRFMALAMPDRIDSAIVGTGGGIEDETAPEPDAVPAPDAALAPPAAPPLPADEPLAPAANPLTPARAAPAATAPARTM